MRNIALLFGGLFLFISCQNQEGKKDLNEVDKSNNLESMTKDSLPEGEWNGEYMKIDDGEKLKIKKKSQGAEYFSMGRVKLNIGEDSVDFKLFEIKKNVLTFTSNSITAFIKSAFNEDIHIYFKKANIVSQHKGKYKVDATGKSNNSIKMHINAGEDGQQKEYNLESGEAEIIHFSPRLGTLEAKISGVFTTKDGKKQKGQGTINLKFDQAIMTAQ